MVKEKRVTAGFYINKILKEDFEKYCNEKFLKQSAVIENLIKEFLEKK